MTWARWARLAALAVCIGMGLAFVIANVRSWELEDADAYWNAAQRLRLGEPLYTLVDPNADESIAYRYAPWFAWLWVPLTYLPKGLVQIGWSAILIGSVVGAISPLVRMRLAAATCLAALLGGLLIRTASTGNVHVLLVAILVLGAHRRSGPAWIGVAASLKFVPVLYVLVYAGRREWGRAAVAVGAAALLTAPTLLYDLKNYPADPGESLSLLSLAGPAPWALVAGAAVIIAVLLASTRYAWAAVSTAIIALLPRLELYGLTYLLVGLDAPRRGEAAESARL